MKWVGFIIAFILLAVVPVWFLQFFKMKFIFKIFLTLILGIIVYFAVERGGWKRGMLTK